MPHRDPPMLPHDLDAEAALVGSLMLRGTLDGLPVTRDDFFSERHALVFDVITTLNAMGIPPDVVLVADRLERAGHLERVGGRSALIDLNSATPSAAHARHYATIVMEKALMRDLIRKCLDLMVRAEAGGDPRHVITDAVEEMAYLVARLLPEEVTT